MPFCVSSSFLQVPFLNLMSSVAQRSGQVNIRVGGNTQDYATLVPSLPDGEMIQKEQTGNTDPVSLVHAPDLLKVLICNPCEDRNTDFRFHCGSSLHAGECFGSSQHTLVPW